MATINLYPYSDKSFVLVGDSTKNYSEALKAVGGKYNASLRDVTDPENNPDQTGTIKGWIFSNKRQAEIEKLLDQISSGELAPQEPKQYVRKTPVAAAKASPKASLHAVATRPPVKPLVPTGAATIKLPPTTIGYQELRYRAIKPTKGMRATLLIEGNQIQTRVIEATPKADGTVDSVLVAPDDKPDEVYKLAVVSGDWKVLGVLDDHTVTFTM